MYIQVQNEYHPTLIWRSAAGCFMTVSMHLMPEL